MKLQSFVCLWLVSPFLSEQTFGAALTTTVVQPNNDTSHWSAAIWDPGPVSPTPGDTCEVLTGARVRTPNGSVASGGTGAPGQTFTFPGASLQLDGIGFGIGTTGELRFKHSFDNTTFAFPGVNGNAGLILNGGMLNDGENRKATITGAIRTLPGTLSSINPGGQNANDIDARRGFIIDATLTGGGDLSLDYAGDTTSSGAVTAAVVINSSNPTFTGKWIINSGWIQGAGNNSLGFGDILLTSLQGASTLDVNYDLTNPTGSLVVETALSKLILDQNLTFGSVTIDGTSLSPGVHTFAELNAAFDANFVDGGAGSIIVVPEPASLALAVVGVCTGALQRRRAKVES
jgi:hypothetical protein